MESKYPPAATFRPGRRLEILDDPNFDPYLIKEKFAGPTVCRGCGAVYHVGHWQWQTGNAPINAQLVSCPACRRIAEDFPAGFVTIDGPFALKSRQELLNLVRHVDGHERAEHPLKRIMAIDEQADRLIITTTDIHLARQIGEALEHAYRGELDFHYNKEEYLLRVHWHR